MIIKVSSHRRECDGQSISIRETFNYSTQSRQTSKGKSTLASRIFHWNRSAHTTPRRTWKSLHNSTYDNISRIENQVWVNNSPIFLQKCNINVRKWDDGIVTIRWRCRVTRFVYLRKGTAYRQKIASLLIYFEEKQNRLINVPRTERKTSNKLLPSSEMW